MTSAGRLIVLLLSWAVPAAGDAGGLPAEECVQLMRSARIAAMHGDAAAEQAKLRAAVDACPEEVAPIHALMSHYRERPEQEESYRQVVAKLSERLRDPGYDLPLGVAEYLLRDPDSQPDELEEILANVVRQTSVESPDPRLLRIQGQLQLRLGQLEAGAESLERLRRLVDSDDLVRTLFNVYAELERWQDAERLLKPLIEHDSRLRYSYLHVLAKLGRVDEVLAEVDRLQKASGEKGGDVADVGEAMGGTLDVDDVDRAGVGLAVVSAFVRSPFDPLLRQVAWDLRDRGRDAEAEKIFRDLLAKTPDNPSLQAIVLHLYAGGEERRRHAASLADAWAAETDPNALFAGGTRKLTAGDAAGAIELLRRAAPEFPDLEAAWYNLGTAAYQLEEWPTVDSAFKRAAELNPDRAENFFFRGIALVKLDRCADAVPALARAVELDPARTVCHYYLNVCHTQLGNHEAAAEARKRYEASRQP